jgi:hypothetical protein
MDTVRFGKDKPDNDFESIKKRILLEPDPYTQQNYVLVNVDVARFDAAFQNESFQYISRGGGGNAIAERYPRFQEHLESGKPIYASTVYLEADGPPGDQTLRASFNDGRHRYAVLRDMGMKTMPIAVHKDGLKLLKAFNLV